MRRAGPRIVLVLAILVVAAYFLRREPREETPRRSLRPVLEAPSPAAAATPAPSTALRPKVPIPVSAPPIAAVPVAGPPGTVRGLVKIRGPLPSRKTVRFDADPHCAELHAGATLFRDDLVADATGNVQWAFVHVKSGPIGAPPPASPSAVTIDQINCFFIPHMVGIRVGQPLRVLNSDPLLHVVHTIPIKNKETNYGLPQAQMETVRRFDVPEVMVKIKCDIHPWMAAWVGVMDHPHFAITNEIGSYMIPDLPAGQYSIEAWHERCEPVTLSIDVPPGGDTRLDFMLDLKSR